MEDRNDIKQLKDIKGKTEFLKTLKTTGLTKKQKDFLWAFSKKMLNVKQACAAIPMSRETYYAWYNSDKSDTFKNAVDTIKEGFFDDVESILHTKVFVDKDTTSIIYYTKTKMKSRGYIEQPLVNNNMNGMVFNEYSKLSEEEIDRKIKETEEKLNG